MSVAKSLQHQSLMEDDLAKELQRRKNRAEGENRRYAAICGKSQEIQDLKQKIQLGYISKNRCVQMEEKQYRTLQGLKEEAQMEHMVLAKDRYYQEKHVQKEEMRRQQRFSHRKELEGLIVQNRDQNALHRQQYQEEKKQVASMVDRIIEDDLKTYQQQQQSKKANYQVMQDMLAHKQENVRRSKTIEKEGLQADRQYQQVLDQRLAQKTQAFQDVLHQKDVLLKTVEEQRAAENYQKEQLHALREQLRLEEHEVREQQKEAETRAMREQKAREVQQAEIYMAQQKKANQQMEKEREQRVLDGMAEKFDRENQVEQQVLRERKVKELQLKQQIEEQWVERQNLFKQERVKDKAFEKYLEQNEKADEEIIQREKERLLREHGMQLSGFMPKGLLDQKFQKGSPPAKSKSNHQSNLKIY